MKIKPVNSSDDIRRVMEAAKADNHFCTSPTCYLEAPGGEIRGYLSVSNVPAFFWSHTKNSKFDSLPFVKSAIAIARHEAERRCGRVILPCSVSSPFVPLLPEFGFEKIGSAELWLLKEGA